MKKLLSVLTLLAIAFSFMTMIGTGSELNKFVITGELVDLKDAQSQEQDLDVKITYGSEETGIEELVSGKLENGMFELQGSIESPKEISLSVLAGETVVGYGEFLLQPNSKTRVEVLISGSTYNIIYLKGYEHSSTNSEHKFTFTGDLSEFGGYHPELTEVFIDCVTYELDGSETYTPFGPVLLDNGKFSIEGDIDGPTGVSIVIEDHSPSDSYSPLFLTAIFEPGVNYEIGTVGNTEEIVVLADQEGVHSKLITDWKSDPEYLELLKQKDLAFEEFVTIQNSDDETKQEIESDLEDNEEPIEETPTLTFAAINPPAPECQHVDLTPIPADTETGLAVSDGYERIEELRQQMTDKRIEFLLPTIQNDDDLVIAWLAYLLSGLEWNRLDPIFLRRWHSDGVLIYDAFTYELDKQKISVLEALTTKYNQNFVTKHITGRIERAFERVSLYQNNKKVIPGQPTPPFTLFTKDGDSVSLHSVLKKNELVLVNFWDSYCDSCIAIIPNLKEMHSTYHAKGFEIIIVHLTRFTYRSRKTFEQNEFPWIDVIDPDDRDLKDWQAPIVTSYTRPGLGVVYETAYSAALIGFLIDGEGCIVRRDMSAEELENVLASRWSEDSAE